jgi:hypothetical protein
MGNPQEFDSKVLSVPAVRGVNTSTPTGAPPESVGVEGQSNLGTGIAGHSTSGFGVFGFSNSNFGVRAVSIDGVGLRATSETGRALEATATQNGIGVVAQGNTGDGVLGISDTGIGVHGESRTNHAVHGESAAGRGVVGISQTFVGVTGMSTSLDGVFGQSTTGIGVHGKGGQLGGFFEGDVLVNGNIHCPNTVHCFDVNITNADCAEEFELAGLEAVEPGTLMSFGINGNLCTSAEAYDTKVAGVISGAGEYKPGIVLDKRQGGNRVPIALLGKVYCKVDAAYSPIEVGDLLTTSPTAGHAMKATDPLKAFGSVIGKALGSRREGRGMIPVLVASK